jgi:hypothetical protein
MFAQSGASVAAILTGNSIYFTEELPGIEWAGSLTDGLRAAIAPASVAENFLFEAGSWRDNQRVT